MDVKPLKKATAWKTHISLRENYRCQSVVGYAPKGQVEPRLIDYVSQAALLQ